MARQPERDRKRLGRRAPQRLPRNRFLIVCEGEVTEKRYFLALRSLLRNSLIHVEPCSGGPRSLVQTAIRRKRDADQQARASHDAFLSFDAVWCVFDVDEHPGIEDACAMAERAGVQVAISNPCFEVWPLLHFQEQRSHVERQRVKTLLRSHLPNYAGALPFLKLETLYSRALERAQGLERHHQELGSPGGNPSTGVHRLTELLRSL
jgi:hypothetical protein